MSLLCCDFVIATQLKEGGTELKLELVDVGGQRGERRRWIHCFEGVDAGQNIFDTQFLNLSSSFFWWWGCLLCIHVGLFFNANMKFSLIIEFRRHFFSVMFIISLSDYNQTLWEDENTNRMQEAEKLFGEMLNNVFFRNTPFIVFFNKFDLFKEKLKKVSLTEAYKEYSAPKEADTDAAKEKHAL